jgi:hypothetical protein
MMDEREHISEIQWLFKGGIDPMEPHPPLIQRIKIEPTIKDCDNYGVNWYLYCIIRADD